MCAAVLSEPFVQIPGSTKSARAARQRVVRFFNNKRKNVLIMLVFYPHPQGFFSSSANDQQIVFVMIFYNYFQ